MKCLFNSNPVVKFSLTKTAVGQLISPEVAFFSSRGPSSISPSVLKVLKISQKMISSLILTDDVFKCGCSLILLLLGLVSWPPGPLLLLPIRLRLNQIHSTSILNREPPWLVHIYLAL